MMSAHENPVKQPLVLPDFVTMLVVFTIYTNLAVIGVRFHGLPPLAAMAVPMLLLIPMVYYILIRREKLVVPSALPWLVAFMVVLMISTVLSRDTRAAFSELTIYLTEGLALYLMLVNVIRSSNMLRAVIWVLLIAGIILGGVPLYQQLTGTFHNNYGGLAQTSTASFRTGEASLQGDVRQPRLSGAVGEINRFAQIMLMLVPLGLFRFYAEKTRTLRLLALLSAGLSGIGMVLAFSRGAAVAFVLLIVLMVFLKVIRPMQLVGFVVVAGVLLLAMPQYTQRLISIQSIEAFITGEPNTEEGSPDGAITGRATVMLAAARVYADHPVVGVGPGMFRYYSREYSLDLGLRYITQNREAHSLYLGMAAEAGTLGLAAFLVMLGVTFRDLLKVRRASLRTRPDLENIATSFMLALLAYLTAGLFLHLSYMRFFWLMFSLASAAGFVLRQELGLNKHQTKHTEVAYQRMHS